MDPSGPWAYTYNRIAVSGGSTSSATTSSSDYQQQNLTTVAGQTVSGTSPTSSTILLQTSNTSGNSAGSFNTGGFISSTPASYEQVFNPIFHHSVPKPAHYNSSLNSHRQNLGGVQVTVNAPEKSESPRQNFSNHGQQQQNFYTEQSTSGTSPSPTTSLVSGTTLTWQGGNTSHITVGDPFSILTQENIQAASPSSSSAQQNNYSAQYQPSQSHLAQIKGSARSSSPQIGGTKTSIQSVPSPIATVSVASSSTQYYRQPTSIASSYSESSAQTGNVINTSKSFSAINPSSLNQTCILVTTSPAVQTAMNQNVTNQKYAKKQNMYNNASRNNAAKNSTVSATITPANLVGNIASNSSSSNNFGIPTTTVKTNNHTLHLVQTKAQSKIYPELVFVDEQDRAKLAEIQQADPQDGSVSYYTIIDGRLAYQAAGNTNLIINESPKGRTVANIQSPRQFVLSNSAEIIAPDGSRIKTEPNYSVSPLQNECTNAIIVPRKQSPSHSTSSQAPSPAYPIYNSPMNSIESPSQHSASSGATHSSSENSGHIVIYKSNTPNQAQIATQSALDASVASRNAANNSLTNASGPVVYSSVITRALVNEQGKVYSPQQTCWDNDIKPKKFYTINSGSQNEIVVPAEIQLKPAYYDPATNSAQIGALHGLKTEEPQVTENILVTTDNPLASQIQITPKIEEHPQPPPPQPAPPQPTPPPKSRRRRNQNSTKTREQLLSENEFLINRVPPPAHSAKNNSIAQETPANINIQQVQPTQSLSQQQNGGTYYDDRWNTHQNVPQQLVVGGSPNISNQMASYGDQQELQHQPLQQQQQQQQVLLTHQPSHHTHYPAQTPYYTTYHVSPNTPGQQETTNQKPSNIEAPSSIPEEHQTQINEQSQQLMTQFTSPTSNSESVKNPTVSVQEETSPQQDEPSHKVVVPNIEEELEFLSTEPTEPGKSNKAKCVPGITPMLRSVPQSTESLQGKTFKVANSAATGFMASYLKFLQGERDSSPPPLGRAQRKTVYQKTMQSASAPVINSVQIAASKTSGQSTSSTVPVKKINEQPAISVSPMSNSTPSIVTAPPQRQVLPVQNQQQTTVPAGQEHNPPAVTTTITTNFAATQTINKKRKVVTENDTEMNKQRKTNNKVKNVAEIAVQTASHPVMLPKKARPQMAMQMASMQQQNKSTNVVLSNQHPSSASMSLKQDQLVNPVISNVQTPITTQTGSTYRYQQQMEEDPLNLPPRRETSFRKAKTRGIEEIMQKKFDNDDLEEPQEFADSDTDPVWTPEDEENELNKSGKGTKRKSKRPKTSYSRSRKACSNILTAAVVGAGIDDSDADNASESSKRIMEGEQNNTRKQINSPKGMKQEAIKAQESSSTFTNSKEEYKTGDFVALRADLTKDWPVLWQVDGKSILQMYEPFSKDGKILYKNMSKYAAWSNDSKRLYLRAPVSIRNQNQNEIIVEFNKSELYGRNYEEYVQRLMNHYLSYRENFDVYVQTLISQSLDQNFFTEITKEKDEYFLSNIKILEDIMENCKRKLLEHTHMAKNIIASIETWPLYNVMADLGHSSNSMNQIVCTGCRHPGATVQFQLYGQPYNSVTMIPVEPDPNRNYERDLMFCLSCKSRAELLYKIVHQKYNLYQICSRKVQDQQMIAPGKGTTAILNDLLADSDWIDQLFSDVRKSWIEVENLERIVIVNHTSP